MSIYDAATVQQKEKQKELLLAEPDEDEPKFVPGCNLTYSVHYYYINSGVNEIENNDLNFTGDDDLTVLGAGEDIKTYQTDFLSDESAGHYLPMEHDAGVLQPTLTSLSTIEETVTKNEKDQKEIKNESENENGSANGRKNGIAVEVEDLSNGTTTGEVLTNNGSIDINSLKEYYENHYAIDFTNALGTDLTGSVNGNGSSVSGQAGTAGGGTGTDSGFFVGSTQSLFVFILNHKLQLFNAFVCLDVQQEGLVSIPDWVMVTCLFKQYCGM